MSARRYPITLYSIADELTYLARLFDFVREVRGQNRGLWVECFQRVGLTEPGQPWCVCFVVTMMAIVFGGVNRSPIPRTASCDELLEHARKNGWLRDDPVPGDIGLLLASPTNATHAFFVVDVHREVTSGNVVRTSTIEGNTDAGGVDGVDEELRPTIPGKVTYIRWPRTYDSDDAGRVR